MLDNPVDGCIVGIGVEPTVFGRFIIFRGIIKVIQGALL